MVQCPHCCKSLGGPASEGGLRVRLGIVLVDQDTGRVHGPCPACKGDVTIADTAQLAKAMRGPVAPEPRPGIRLRR